VVGDAAACDQHMVLPGNGLLEFHLLPASYHGGEAPSGGS